MLTIRQTLMVEYQLGLKYGRLDKKDKELIIK